MTFCCYLHWGRAIPWSVWSLFMEFCSDIIYDDHQGPNGAGWMQGKCLNPYKLSLTQKKNSLQTARRKNPTFHPCLLYSDIMLKCNRGQLFILNQIYDPKDPHVHYWTFCSALSLLWSWEDSDWENWKFIACRSSSKEHRTIMHFFHIVEPSANKMHYFHIFFQVYSGM